MTLEGIDVQLSGSPWQSEEHGATFSLSVKHLLANYLSILLNNLQKLLQLNNLIPVIQMSFNRSWAVWMHMF